MSSQNSNEKKNIFLYLSALFITNVGNSASFIICGKYTYDYFGLASVFGALLIMESVQAILFSGFAGYITDRVGAKKISIICDLFLFLIVLTGGIWSSFYSVSWSVVLVYFIINLVKPFQNTAIFALTKNVVEKDEDLFHLNSKVGMVFQLGYLVGLGVTGFFIKYLTYSNIMLLDSLTFLLSAIFILFIKFYEKKEKVIVRTYLSFFTFGDIKEEYLKMLRKNSQLLLLCLIIGIQINLIIAYNTNLFKLVAEKLENNAFNLSILEASYTVSCIVISLLLSKKNFIKIKASTLFYYLILQSLVFFMIPRIGTILTASVLAIIFGMVSSVLFPSLFSSLYKCIVRSDAGKLGGLKSMIQSTIAIPVLIFNSFLVDHFNLSYGYCFLAIISLFGCFLVYSAFNKNKKLSEVYE